MAARPTVAGILPLLGCQISQPTVFCPFHQLAQHPAGSDQTEAGSDADARAEAGTIESAHACARPLRSLHLRPAGKPVARWNTRRQSSKRLFRAGSRIRAAGCDVPCQQRVLRGRWPSRRSGSASVERPPAPPQLGSADLLRRHQAISAVLVLTLSIASDHCAAAAAQIIRQIVEIEKIVDQLTTRQAGLISAMRSAIACTLACSVDSSAWIWRLRLIRP